MTSQQEPKPCPFCGEEPEVEGPIPHSYGDRWTVICHGPNCPDAPMILDGVSRREAVASWNAGDFDA